MHALQSKQLIHVIIFQISAYSPVESAHTCNIFFSDKCLLSSWTAHECNILKQMNTCSPVKQLMIIYYYSFFFFSFGTKNKNLFIFYVLSIVQQYLRELIFTSKTVLLQTERLKEQLGLINWLKIPVVNTHLH